MFACLHVYGYFECYNYNILDLYIFSIKKFNENAVNFIHKKITENP